MKKASLAAGRFLHPFAMNGEPKLAGPGAWAYLLAAEAGAAGAAEAADAAGAEAGAAAEAGAEAGAASSFLPQAARARAAIMEANNTDFFI